MSVHVFVFRLVVCLLLCLALLWRLGWFPHRAFLLKRRGHSLKAQRLLQSRAAQTIAPPVVSPPLPQRLSSRCLCLCVPGAR